MHPAIASSVGIVAYMALFALVGVVFLFVNLLVGKLLRPHDPHPEKLEIYECGKPTIGSSFVQFDLRFYVVALLFIIFDVEIAFFFPWATVFGKATHLMDPNLPAVAAQRADATIPAARARWSEEDRQLALERGQASIVQKFGELGVPQPSMDKILAEPAQSLEENAA